MAYTQRDFVRDLALWSTATLTGVTRQRKFLEYAARRGIQLAALGATRVAPAAGRLAMRSPVGAGVGIGLGALATQPGQDLLALAEEHGRQSRILFERAQQELMTTPQRIEAAAMSQPVSIPPDLVPRLKKRAVSKFNKAVSKGMKIVRNSTSFGKKGTINNAKRAFSTVTKVVSLKKKKKKAPRSGIRAKIFRGIKGIL
jgi:hypothetical protein